MIIPVVIHHVLIDMVLELQGKEDTQLIPEWSLIQSGGSSNKHLAVVSAPMTWRDSKGKKEGKFSYLLQFIIQTQAGSDEPWIAVYMSIRRWVTKPVKSTNFKRDVSVYLRLSAPWITDGQYSNTLIQLKLEGNYNKTKKGTKSSLNWKDNPSSLIDNLKGGKGRGLVDPQTLVESPLSYHNPSKDQYYVLHAEGMKYEGNKGHPVETGTALVLRGQIMTYITDHLGAYLEPDTAMIVDANATLQVKTVKGKAWASIRGDKLTALFNNKDLSAVSLSPRGATDAEKIQKKIELTVQGLMKSSNNRRIRILTFYRGEGGRTTLPRYTAKTLFLDENTELPVQIELIPPIAIPDVIAKPVASEYKTKSDLEVKRYLQREFRNKVDSWEAFLTDHIDEDAYNLAFIEMDNEIFKLEDCTKWLKQAIRRACVEVGVNSQMIYFLPPESNNPKKSLFYAGDLSRTINANFDLLLRQTALRYGEPSGIYALAGLDEDKAQELIVVGLYRHVTSYPTAIDYPLAVISYPDGRTEVILPDEKGDLCKPIPYLQAGIEIGRTFANTGKNRSLYNYYNEKPKSKNGYRLKRFAEKVLIEVNSWGNPSLILMEAEWRKWGLLPIGNQMIQKNALAINNKVNVATDLPNLRLLRIRDCGTNNETPQYVELREGETWDKAIDADDPQVMTGVIDSHAESPFTHYFSIGQQPDAFKNKVDNQALTFETNSANAHKHQRAIEFVPFFLQEEDDELAYCRIAHFLRSSPAWRGGNISLPYPLHLAKTLIDDQLDVFEPSL
ncbi:MAG: hypothetical protein Phog2KO_50600 [Phototrophicaceae bacterium]